MTLPNKFTKTQEKRIYDVGRRIEEARKGMRLSIRGAAERTVTSRGKMTEATWRRVERGYIQVAVRGVTERITYRPTGETIVAMAEVVSLDGEALCKELELEPPPARVRLAPTTEIEAIRQELLRLTERLGQLESAPRRSTSQPAQ
jgi:hypothetical protein